MAGHQTTRSMQYEKALDGVFAKYGRDIAKRTLARILFQAHPNLFNSIEIARSVIRTRLGMQGVQNRARQQPEKREENNRHAEAKWPEGITDFDWQPYALPDMDGLWLIIADLHIPFTAREPLMATVKFAKSLGKKLKGILILGDLLDQYNCSWWRFNPSIVTYEKELEEGRSFIYKLKAEFPRCKIVYKFANHEDRFDRVVMYDSIAVQTTEDALRLR
jgi:hypothetical protein